MPSTPMVDLPRHTRALYFDVEMTCWAGPPPLGMKQEIIEIGVTEMDLQSLSILREKPYFVRPRRWEISPCCTELTGITSDDIRTARPFPEVLAALTDEFSPSKAMCGTWGDDAALIAAACQAHGLKSPLRYLVDVAHLFPRLFLLREQVSLAKAIEILELGFDGMPHSALADARNTARVHAALIRRMRREPDPPTIPDSQPESKKSMSPFGEQLLRALEQGERSTCLK
jgi:inhibitor of KinA sporulation pathway (predicted exonuclease)